jgi:hypothetical protein
MSDQLYGLDLERCCVRPGFWRIEGYEVFRIGAARSGLRWSVRRSGKVAHTARTLREARVWIAEQIEQARPVP